MFHDLTQGILSAVWVDPCLFPTHHLSASLPPPTVSPSSLSHRLPSSAMLSLSLPSLSLCLLPSFITLPSLPQFLSTVCYSLVPRPSLPPSCLPSLQYRALKVNVCFHLSSSFSLPISASFHIYLHPPACQVFPPSSGYSVWLQSHPFFFTLPLVLRSHSDVGNESGEKRRGEEQDAD